MQKIFIIFTLIFSHFFQINAQLDQLFEQYQEAEGVTSIKISKSMFNMLKKLNIDDSELSQIKPLLNKINGLKILIVEKPESLANLGNEEQRLVNIAKKLQTDIATSIKNMKYKELMSVNSKDNKIKFLSSDAANGILDNLLLSIHSDGNQVLMMLDGKISMDDINNLINEAEKSASINSITSSSSSSSSSINVSNNSNDTNSGISQVRNVGKFSGISVSSGIKVNFTQGSNQSVVIDADQNMQQYVSTEVQNGILNIGINNKGKKNLNFKKLMVNVEAPQLSSAKVSSGSNFTTMNTITENDFRAEISSGANLNADLNIKNNVNIDVSSGSSAKIDVRTNSFDLQESSGSMATVTGNSEKVSLNLSNAASCNAQNLVGNNVNAQASSGSNIKVHAKERLTAVSSSGSSIRYTGNPTKNSVKESSGGSIKPIN